jgi:penicillin G amidase
VRNLLRWFNIGVALLLVAAGGLTAWYVGRPLAKLSGSLKMPVAAKAEVARDKLGVPHIRAGSLDDALFLQGYVHAQDRLFQMDGLRRLAAGELAEVVGAAALESDRESRRLRMKRVAEQHYAAMPADERRLFTAYARGVNHFIETNRGRLPVEFTLLGYDPAPWSAVDSILAGMQMFRSLTNTWREEVLKKSLLAKGDAEKIGFLFPERSGDEVQLGSNAWVVSGKHTASGKPILANDTHLEWGFPGPWYSVHLTAPGLNVAGFSLAGLPLVLIGHNERIAWGITNLHFDVQDLYLERFDAASGRYVFQEQLEQARLETDVIRVKNGKNVDFRLWVTRHGPVFFEAQGAAYTLRWAGAEPGFHFPFLNIAKAGNWPQFTQALSRMPGPGSNLLYADVDGNIGYHAVGRFPIRENHRGDLPADGVSGKNEWSRMIPFEDLPSAYNPASGRLVTANQNPFPASYRHPVHGNFASPYRSRQIETRISARGGWKPEDMLRIQTDVYSAFSHFLAQELVKAWKARGQNNPNLAEPAKLLAAWDGQMRTGAPEPFLVSLAYQAVRKAIGDSAAPGQGANYEFQMAPAVIEKLLRARPAGWFADYDQMLLQAFSDSVEEGKKLQGGNPAKWDYGRYTMFALPHPVLGRLPYAGSWFTIGPVPMAGSATTVKQTSRRLGPSMRFIADLSDWDKSLHSLTIGQSGQPLSKHFRDQWDAYYAGRAFAMPFLKVEAADVLTVTP